MFPLPPIAGDGAGSVSHRRGRGWLEQLLRVECDFAAGFMPRISLSVHGLLPKAVSHASGYSPLGDDAQAARRRLCLTKHVPRDCCHLDYGQHDLGCTSRNFQRASRCRLAHSFSFVDQFALIARGRTSRARCRASQNFQEDEAMVREHL